MKILYILPTLFRGGAEKSTLFLASKMQEAENAVSLLSIRAGGSLLKDARASGIPVYDRRTLRECIKDGLPDLVLELYYRLQIGRHLLSYTQPINLAPPQKDPALERWVKRKIRAIAPDIVHVHQSSCVEALQWAKQCGVRAVLYTPHEMIGELSDGDDVRGLNALVGAADHIIFVSFAQRDDFLEHIDYPRHQTSVIYPRTMFNGEARTEYRTSAPLILGTLSNLSPTKNPMILLDALKSLRDTGENVELLIAGGDPRWKAVVHDAVRKRGLRNEVRFVGALDSNEQLCSFYSGIDVYVSTSSSESFGLTMVEAMSCGVPIIASDVKPIKEIIEEGTNGLLFKRGDVVDLISKIRYFIRNPHQRKVMGLRAVEQYEKRFAKSPYFSIYEQIYAQSLRS